MPLLHVKLFNDKTSISVPQGLRKANFKLKGYRVLFTQDKHGYYHASINTNLIQNGSVIAYVSPNSPTSTTYDIPLLIDPDQKQTLYENCDWNLGFVDNLPSSIFFNITFYNCIQRTRFDRAFFNSTNIGFQNLFNNVSQGTSDLVTVSNYMGEVIGLFHENDELACRFTSRVNLLVNDTIYFKSSWCNEIKINTPYYIKNIIVPVEQAYIDQFGSENGSFHSALSEFQNTDPEYVARFTISDTVGGVAINFSGTEDNLSDILDEPVLFIGATPGQISQSEINKKFEKTPMYPYLPAPDFVTGYKYDPQGNIIEGNGSLSTTNYYPSAGKYVNTGVHVYSNHDMEQLYDDTPINTEEVIQNVNSKGFIKGSGIRRHAIIFPYTVDLIFEYY